MQSKGSVFLKFSSKTITIFIGKTKILAAIGSISNTQSRNFTKINYKFPVCSIWTAKSCLWNSKFSTISSY